MKNVLIVIGVMGAEGKAKGRRREKRRERPEIGVP
jgi:hypothetical protein